MQPHLFNLYVLYTYLHTEHKKFEPLTMPSIFKNVSKGVVFKAKVSLKSIDGKRNFCIQTHNSNEQSEVLKQLPTTHATSNLGKGVEQKQSDYQPKKVTTEKN